VQEGVEDIDRAKFLIQTKNIDPENIYEYDSLRVSELNIKSGKWSQIGEINATVTLQKIATGIGADFHVTFHVEYACMRCLCNFARDFDVTMRLDYIEGEDPYVKMENVELAAHDADRVYYHGPHIDLSVGIREAIILAQPITPICKQDCSGLCPICGANLNVKRCGCKVEKVGPFTPRSDATAK